MNKSNSIMFFLGQVKARIEEINRCASFNSSDELKDVITDLEQFFNQGFNELTNSQQEDGKPQKFSGRMELTLWT